MVYEVFAFGQYSPLYTENDDRPKRLTVANNFLSHQRGNSLSLDLSNESKSRGVAGLLSALLMCINRHNSTNFYYNTTLLAIMADEEDIAALVIDNGSGMCKG
jgi:hypothetical protein